MPRSYLGEPVKTRLVHGGSEMFHVHHLHGGGRTYEGKELVLTVNNPSTEMLLSEWVENQLPPQGVSIDDLDASVWDWTTGGCDDSDCDADPACQCAGLGESCQSTPCCAGLTCPGGKPSNRVCQ